MMMQGKHGTVSLSGDFPFDKTIGYVVKTAKKLQQDAVGVYVPRLIPGIDPSTAADDVKINIKGTKIKNSKNKNFYKKSFKKANYLILPLEHISNVSNPQHNLGERVNIEMYDQDIKSMYVKNAGLDDEYRRSTESYKVYAKASSAENTPSTESNTYFLKLDGENKFVKLHMSSDNGEIAQYDLLFDGKNGVISLTDGERSFNIATRENIISMKNPLAKVVLNKGNIIIDGNNIDIRAKNKINIVSPNLAIDAKNYTLKSTVGKEDIKQFNIISSNMKVESKNYTLDTMKALHKYTKFDLDGLSMSMKQGTFWPKTIAFKKLMSDIPIPGLNPTITPEGIVMLGPLGSGQLARAKDVIAQLTDISIKVDMLAGIFGIPPDLMLKLGLRMITIPSPNIQA